MGLYHHTLFTDINKGKESKVDQSFHESSIETFAIFSASHVHPSKLRNCHKLLLVFHNRILFEMQNFAAFRTLTEFVKMSLVVTNMLVTE